MCCYGSNAASIGFYGIQTNWDITTIGYTGLRRGQGYGEKSNGRNFKCLVDANLSSGTYSFNNAKRAVGEQECQKADTLLSEDGQKYDIEGLDDGYIAELLELTHKGTTAADMPERFVALKKTE